MLKLVADTIYRLSKVCFRIFNDAGAFLQPGVFQNLIDETRGTFGGVNYVAPANE